MSDLLADAIEELYEADPDGFTERRQELVAGAREAGQAAVAKQIAGLRKPTRSAWVVNRLVRTDPEVVPRLAALAAELRDEPSMDGARIRELTAARGRLVDELTRQALRVSEPACSARGAARRGDRYPGRRDRRPGGGRQPGHPGAGRPLGRLSAWLREPRSQTPHRNAPPLRRKLPRPTNPGRLRPRPSVTVAARKRLN